MDEEKAEITGLLVPEHSFVKCIDLQTMSEKLGQGYVYYCVASPLLCLENRESSCCSFDS